MRECIILLILALSSTAVVAESGQRAPTLVEVEDADTLRVELDGAAYRIQLVGIDAPESVPNPKLMRDVERTGRDAESLLALGRAADQGLRELLPDFMPYQLHFDPEVRDKYGRTPGDLLDDRGRWLSVRLVEAGYAIPRGKVDAQRRAELERALELARSEGRGLWGSSPDGFAAWEGMP